MTNSVWGVERRAVRDYMKTGWKEGNRALIVKINTRKVSEENAAKEEAGQILEVKICKLRTSPAMPCMHALSAVLEVQIPRWPTA